MDLRVVMPEADDLGVGMREVVDSYQFVLLMISFAA
jgi:hypothetical protein